MKGYVRSFTSVIASFAVFAAFTVTGNSSSLHQQKSNEKFHDKLADIIRDAGPDELVQVTIVMRDQTLRDRINLASNIADKQIRRQVVINALKETASDSQGGLLELLNQRKNEGKVAAISSLWIHNVVVAKVTPAVAFEVAARGDVDYLNDEARIGKEVFPYHPGRGQPIPGPRGRAIPGPEGNVECGVSLMGAPQVWNDFGITGQGAIVCVIDTGCCLTHDDLENQLWVNEGEIPGNGIDDDANGHVDDINGWNFRDNTPNVADEQGHGTHVSGTVVGDGADGIQTGMAPDAKLMTCKFWNNFSGEQVAWNCMQYGVENGADVLSGSFGWPQGFSQDRATWRMICENAMAAGVVLVFAAGNEGGSVNSPDDVRTPGDVPDILTAGATDCSDIIADFSSRGPSTWQNESPYFDWPFPPGKTKPTVCAPGVDTISTSSSCSGYVTLSGTSMAAPHISGAVALMLSANPDLDHFQVKQILKDTAIDFGQTGADNVYGSGRVDVYAAVQAALDLADTVVEADSLNVFRGMQTAGDLSDASESDDTYLKFRPGITLGVGEPPVWLIFDATLPNDSPSSLTVTLEASANTGGLQQEIEMYNWNTTSYEQVDAQNAGLTDTVVNVDVSAGISDYVQSGTGAVRTRVGWRAVGPIAVFPWTICVDQIVWTPE
jgi:subtilisin family serine protease